ncbi:MAG: hypothetical protein IT384_16415 [Deltaproteobacteria bacterium]|nr:hypothetical protein [Deltaproteobacteria bacterium]
MVTRAPQSAVRRTLDRTLKRTLKRTQTRTQTRTLTRTLLGAAVGAGLLTLAGQIYALAGVGCSFLCDPEVSTVLGAAAGAWTAAQMRYD